MVAVIALKHTLNTPHLLWELAWVAAAPDATNMEHSGEMREKSQSAVSVCTGVQRRSMAPVTTSSALLSPIHHDTIQLQEHTLNVTSQPLLHAVVFSIPISTPSPLHSHSLHLPLSSSPVMSTGFPMTAHGLGTSPWGDYSLFTLRMSDPAIHPYGDLSFPPNKANYWISLARLTSPQGVQCHVYYEPGGQTTGMLYHNPGPAEVQLYFKLTKKSGVSHRGESKCYRSRPGETLKNECVSLTGCTYVELVDVSTFNSLAKF